MDTTASKNLTTTAQDWLTSTGIITNAAYTADAIATHPDYPAMTALTDFLESGGMEYDAVQADASYIHEFNYPLLAHIKQPGNEYLHLINDATQWDKQKDVTKDWSGVALYGVKNAIWHNDENDAAEKIAQKNKYLAAAFVIAGLALFVGSVFILHREPKGDAFSKGVTFWFSTSIFGLLSLAGLAISIAALGTELGYQSKIVKQVCGTVGNGGCEKVLGSKFAKGIAGITPADASVLYFAAQFILYLVGCFYFSILSTIITIAFAGIAVAVWSIYTQAVKVKEWCALCLCIVAVLLGQIIIASYTFYNIELEILIPYSQLLTTLTTFPISIVLLTIIYLPIKTLLKTNNKNKQQLAAFKKWKTDANLFMAQWQNEPTCDNTICENDLLVGNANAPIRITVACNPYCGPCAKAHKELDELVEKYPGKVCFQVRLLFSKTNSEDKLTIAAKAILEQAIYLSNKDAQRSETSPSGVTPSQTAIKKMLSDWFDWMNYEKWNDKWTNNINVDVQNNLAKHSLWIENTGITHTPTFFINGRKLPGRYNLNDMEKMIPQLQEVFANV